jgi:hypothetical protein
VTGPGQIVEAAAGWRDLLRRRPGWQGRFDLSRQGLKVAGGLYLVAVVLNVALQMILAGQITPLQLVANLAINLLPLLGLGLGVAITVLALRQRGALYPLLVPATFALAFALLIGMPLSLIELPIGPLLLIGLAYLLVRLGQAACGFGLRTSIAFAALCLVLLVALPAILYMLLAAIPGVS